jgi:CII-binding regulator of phage lambda lysogenization HflD
MKQFVVYILIFFIMYIILHNIFFITVIEGFIKKIEKKAKKTGKAVEKTAKQTGKAVEKTADKAIKGLTSLDPTKAIKELEKMIKNIDKNVKQINTKFTSNFNNLSNNVKQINTKFTLNFNKLSNNVKQINTKFTSNINNSIKNIQKIDNNVKQIDNELTKSTNDIKNFGNEIEKIGKSIEEIPKQIDETVLGKFNKFFTQLGDILNNGIIKPLETLFIGLGNVFVQIFSILMLIGNKIITLPGCIFYYIFDGIFAAIYGIYKLILPTFLMKWVINPIASVFNWFLDLFGYNKASRRCRAFNIKQEVRNMDDEFKQIDKSFKKDFGKLDFSKIKL